METNCRGITVSAGKNSLNLKSNRILKIESWILRIVTPLIINDYSVERYNDVDEDKSWTVRVFFVSFLLSDSTLCCFFSLQIYILKLHWVNPPNTPESTSSTNTRPLCTDDTAFSLWGRLNLWNYWSSSYYKYHLNWDRVRVFKGAQQTSES